MLPKYALKIEYILNTYPIYKIRFNGYLWRKEYSGKLNYLLPSPLFSRLQ